MTINFTGHSVEGGGWTEDLTIASLEANPTEPIKRGMREKVRRVVENLPGVREIVRRKRATRNASEDELFHDIR